MTRRKILIMAGAMVLVSAAGIAWPLRHLQAEEMALYPGDRILGDRAAPVTILEYSSLTCPHCAAFHRDTLPKIKETWIAEGKAKLVYRHFPLDGVALRAAAVANCIEGERFFSFLDVLFKSQKRWAKSKDPMKAIGQIARLAGLSGDKFESCANDQAEMDKILAVAQEAKVIYGIASTPTLIINGRKIEGARSYDYISRIVKEVTQGT